MEMLQKREYILLVPLFLVVSGLGYSGIPEMKQSAWVLLLASTFCGALGLLFVRKLKYRRDEPKDDEGELEEGVRKLGAVLDGMGEGITIIDREMRIIFASSIFKNNFGGDIVGRRCYDVLPEAPRRGQPCCGCGIWETLLMEPSKEHEIMKKATGIGQVSSASWRIEEARIEQRYGDRYIEYFLQTFPIGEIYVFGRDITERKKTEQLLLRTQKLASVGQLAAGVVHEVNNPLGNVILYADMLLRKARGRDKEKLELIKDQAELAAGRLRNLLEFSRPSEVDHEVVCLDQVINKCLASLNPLLMHKRIHVRQNIINGVLVKGNAVELQQVFTNIILNAIHAMSEEGKLDVSIKKAGGEVRVEISDSGEGIPNGDLDKIFDPFYTTKDRGEGTGLGLFIARMIVTNHRGRIEVKSSKGRGSTFAVVLREGGVHG